MGGGNPIKKLAKFTSDLVAKPIRETARFVGAKGVVDGINKFRDKRDQITGGIIDLTSGKASKMKKEAQAQAGRAASVARSASKERERLAGVAANDLIESERMSVGSGSRTLLTGGQGLEDDDESVSRRTLRGF